MPASRNLWFKSWRQMLKSFDKIKKNEEKVSFVGRDHLGNKYFEVEKPTRGRPVRRYFEREDFTDVTSFPDIARVPPVWDSWLRFKRTLPPTQDEMRESEEYFKMQQARAAEKSSYKETKDTNEGSGNSQKSPS